MLISTTKKYTIKSSLIKIIRYIIRIKYELLINKWKLIKQILGWLLNIIIKIIVILKFNIRLSLWIRN